MTGDYELVDNGDAKLCIFRINWEEPIYRFLNLSSISLNGTSFVETYFSNSYLIITKLCTADKM